jgi:hypothetical protein
MSNIKELLQESIKNIEKYLDFNGDIALIENSLVYLKKYKKIKYSREKMNKRKSKEWYKKNRIVPTRVKYKDRYPESSKYETPESIKWLRENKKEMEVKQKDFREHKIETLFIDICDCCPAYIDKCPYYGCKQSQRDKAERIHRRVIKKIKKLREIESKIKKKEDERED